MSTIGSNAYLFIRAHIDTDGGHIEHTLLHFIITINRSFVTRLSFTKKFATIWPHVHDNDIFKIGYRKTHISGLIKLFLHVRCYFIIILEDYKFWNWLFFLYNA